MDKTSTSIEKSPQIAKNIQLQECIGKMCDKNLVGIFLLNYLFPVQNFLKLQNVSKLVINSRYFVPNELSLLLKFKVVMKLS